MPPCDAHAPRREVMREHDVDNSYSMGASKWKLFLVKVGAALCGMLSRRA